MNRTECLRCETSNSEIAKYCSGCGAALPKPEVVKIELPEVKKQNEKTLTKKKIVSAVVTVCAFFITYFGVQYLFFNPSIDKELMKIASEINESCPIMIDRETQLNNTVSMPGKVLRYNYTMVTMLKDETDIEDFRAILEPMIFNLVKTQPDMQTLRENKVSFSYNYKDKDGFFLTDIKVKPSDYQ